MSNNLIENGFPPNDDEMLVSEKGDGNVTFEDLPNWLAPAFLFLDKISQRILQLTKKTPVTSFKKWHHSHSQL